jgi:signal transduction histidine kinase
MNLMDNVYFPVLVFEDNGRLLLVNSEASRILGLGGSVGHHMPDYLSPIRDFSSFNMMGRKLVRVVTGDGPYLFTVRHMDVEGYPRMTAAVGEKERLFKPINSDSDTLGNSAALAGEVTQKVKGQLAGIELYASILDEELAENDGPGLSSIVDSIRSSVRDVNEYLTSFESMTKDLHLDIKEINISEVIDEALAAVGELFKSKGIGLLVDQNPLTVLADHRLLVQVFLNIFLNALEAMPHGGRLTVNIRQDNVGHVEVLVIDTGPGVDYRQSKEIFNPFYTTKNQPLGLGLPVSRRIVEAHQGSIHVGSDMVMGALVKVTLPIIGQMGTN